MLHLELHCAGTTGIQYGDAYCFVKLLSTTFGARRLVGHCQAIDLNKSSMRGAAPMILRRDADLAFMGKRQRPSLLCDEKPGVQKTANEKMNRVKLRPTGSMYVSSIYN
jgi:hypothetical protein